jgi:hypothetical protein
MDWGSSRRVDNSREKLTKSANEELEEAEQNLGELKED